MPIASASPEELLRGLAAELAAGELRLLAATAQQIKSLRGALSG